MEIIDNSINGNVINGNVINGNVINGNVISCNIIQILQDYVLNENNIQRSIENMIETNSCKKKNQKYEKNDSKNKNCVNYIYENGNENVIIENCEVDENLYCYCKKLCSEGDMMISKNFS